MQIFSGLSVLPIGGPIRSSVYPQDQQSQPGVLPAVDARGAGLEGTEAAAGRVWGVKGKGWAGCQTELPWTCKVGHCPEKSHCRCDFSGRPVIRWSARLGRLVAKVGPVDPRFLAPPSGCWRYWSVDRGCRCARPSATLYDPCRGRSCR